MTIWPPSMFALPGLANPDSSPIGEFCPSGGLTPGSTPERAGAADGLIPLASQRGCVGLRGIGGEHLVGFPSLADVVQVGEQPRTEASKAGCPQSSRFKLGGAHDLGVEKVALGLHQAVILGRTTVDLHGEHLLTGVFFNRLDQVLARQGDGFQGGSRAHGKWGKLIKVWLFYG